MMRLDFARRSNDAELMDADGASSAELRSTFHELARINRILGGHAVTLKALSALTPPGTKHLRILDVGCGDGEGASLILDWARARGIDAEVRGIDVSAASVSLARERSRPGLSFSREDLFLPGGEDFDIVHAALVLHHCTGDLAARALKTMHGRARLGVAINDLHRHPAAYYGIKAISGALSRDRLIRHDAPLSVLRGFSRAELEESCRAAGLPAPEIRWQWAFRWRMVVRR